MERKLFIQHSTSFTQNLPIRNEQKSKLTVFQTKLWENLKEMPRKNGKMPFSNTELENSWSKIGI